MIKPSNLISLTIVDNFNGLGLFFDTYPNSRHTYSFPRATAMLGDGKTPYDHDHDNQANELAACSVGLDCRIIQIPRHTLLTCYFPISQMDFRRRDTRTMLKLRYIKNKSLSLQLQVEKEGRWDDCFEAQNVEMPAGDIYLGFSALTGDVSDAHE
jgi:mannose-binding lectin 2